MGTEKEEISKRALSDGNAAARRPRESFTSLYESFRAGGLSKVDSAFNALYICQCNKMCRRRLDTEAVGEGFFSHPAGWYKTGREKVRRAARTKTLRFLEFVAKIIAPFTESMGKEKSSFFEDSSTRAIARALSSFKKALPATAVVLSACLLVVTVWGGAEKRTVIEVSVDGVKVAEVLSSDTVETALERVNSRMSAITGESFSFPYELSFKSKRSDASDTLDVNELYTLLCGYTDGDVTYAYGLYIDSNLVAVLADRKEIVSVLETLCIEHMELSGEEENIANNIEIKYQEYSACSIIDAQTLHDMLAVTKEPEEPVQRSVDALLSTNASSATLRIDAEASELEEKIAEAVGSVEKEKEDAPRLDFAVYYEKTVRENVPYTTTYIEDDEFYENQEFVQVSGRNGLADNTYRIKYVNGEEDSREIIEQSFIRKPRESVVKIGTRRLPERMTDKENGGKYMINPVPGARISDHFGQRILKGKSDYHEGLDLAAWVGTPIYASASGEVIYAGYSATYGYVAKILHDDGLVSVYAHCSKLLVELGDSVSQADKIAEVGSTGFSYGYHCHFEVVKDGVKVDPEDYIYSLD